MNTISKIRGQGKVAPYPQPEGILGEHMIKHGKDYGEETSFGEFCFSVFYRISHACYVTMAVCLKEEGIVL